MEEEGFFNANVTVHIKNLSNDSWNDIPLYFIPNMFTNTNSPTLRSPADITIHNLYLDGKPINYSLEKDTLTVPLENSLKKGETTTINVTYTFTLPKEGFRFSKVDSTYSLAQWYPMVPTYRKGWNKEDFRFKGESYHTPFSDFNFTFEVPDHFTVVTSSENDVPLSTNRGTVHEKNIKEFYVAIVKEPLVLKKKVDEIEVRLFASRDTSLEKELLELAAEAIGYFQGVVGPYPHKQLDIVLSDDDMEYPGVVTVNTGSNQRVEGIKKFLVHEVAHQWFYGVISSDPYHDAWLDEGLTNVATALFFDDKNGEDITIPHYYNTMEAKPVNLSLDQYTNTDYTNYIYGYSSNSMLKLFKDHGGIKEAEDFLREYYNTYRYKEVTTTEFIRFVKQEWGLEDNSEFEKWIDFEEENY